MSEPSTFRPTDADLRRLLFDLDYEGPFARLMNWLWAIDPKTHELWREVRPGTLRNWLAERAEWADIRWKRHYTRTGRTPSERWRRRTP
jgi:hypothetical protein